MNVLIVQNYRHSDFQVQFSLLDRRPLGPNGMLQLCKERGLKLLCYGVVGGGLLSDRYLAAGNSKLYGESHFCSFLSSTCRVVCAAEQMEYHNSGKPSLAVSCPIPRVLRQ